MTQGHGIKKKITRTTKPAKPVVSLAPMRVSVCGISPVYASINDALARIAGPGTPDGDSTSPMPSPATGGSNNGMTIGDMHPPRPIGQSDDTGVSIWQSRMVLLRNAWDAYNSHKWADAVKDVQPCVDKLGVQAMSDQLRIENDSQQPLPPGGADINDPSAQHTYSNHTLNDASACLYILANSEERLHRCYDAMHDYQLLEKLTLARVWDSQGWFWAPSDTASDAINRVRNACGIAPTLKEGSLIVSTTRDAA